MILINKEEQEIVKSIFREIGNQFELAEKNLLVKQFQACLEGVHNRLQKGIKYRNVSKLAPITLFMFLKVKNISFQKKQFLQTLDLEEEEFNHGLKRIVPAYPAYQERDRINIIGSKLKDVLTTFNLRNGFLKRCETIFKYFYPKISHSTDGTITGVFAVLSLLTLDMEDTSLSEVCKYSGTTLGSVHNAIKRIIFNKNERSQFQGLVKSKALVKTKIAEKVGTPLTTSTTTQRTPIKAKTKEPFDHNRKKGRKISSLPKGTSSKIRQGQCIKKPYKLSDKNMQEIIRLHFFELSAEKISDLLNLNLYVVKSVLNDFTNGNISFESKETSEIKPTDKIDINSFNLKENPFPQNGSIVKIEKLSVICEKCKNPLLKLVYENDKTIFFCKYCFE